jgi:hypothetical protein
MPIPDVKAIAWRDEMQRPWAVAYLREGEYLFCLDAYHYWHVENRTAGVAHLRCDNSRSSLWIAGRDGQWVRLQPAIRPGQRSAFLGHLLAARNAR